MPFAKQNGLNLMLIFKKMNASIRFILCGLFILPGVIHAQKGTQQEMGLSQTDAPYGYYEYLPEGYSPQEGSVPLIIFLHGLGEIGDGEQDLWKLKAHGPHKMIEQGADFPAVILSPQSVSWWDIPKIGAFVDWVFLHYRVDTTRLYVTGLSMGGGGVWLYARDFPHRPAAIVPICGAADPSQPENLADIPTWAFHNVGDPTVDVELTYGWINGIRAAGGTPKLTIYPVQGHDAWTETYHNQEVWDWMFAQQLGAEQPLQVADQEIPAKIYPNPFNDQLRINTSQAILSARLFSLKGKIVTEWASFEQEGENISVNIVPKIPPGIYLLELESAQGMERFKVIKE